MCLGIPGRVVAITDETRNLASVDFSGVRREVDLTCVVERNLADCIDKWVLVHVGFAMSIIDEEEARKTLKALEALGEVEEEYEAMRRSTQALEAV